MKETQERALVQRAQAGDQAAFEQLIISAQNGVYALALKMLRHNEQDALDVTQDAFLKAYLNIGKYRGDARFSVWIYRITYNLCLDRLRKTKRRAETSLDGEDDEFVMQIADASPLPEERVLSLEASAAVRRGLDSLPPKQRAVLIMREVSGLSYAEIAVAAGLREGTVKSRINRARAALADYLRRDGTFFDEMRHNYVDENSDDTNGKGR